MSHIDATEGVIEPFMANRVDSLRTTAESPDINASVKIFRGGSKPLNKVAKGLLTLGLEAAPAIAGFAIGGPVGLAIGSAMSFGLHKIGITQVGVGNVASGFMHRKMVQGEDWKGSQTIDFKNQQERTQPRKLDDDLSANKAQAFFADKLRPGQVNVVHLAGHGSGIQQSAGLRTSKMAEALEGASEDSGVRPDVLVFESCLQGNLEALSVMDDTAKYAVVAQEPLAAVEKEGGLPLQKMLSSMAQSSGVESGVKSMMGEAEKHGVHTLAAIDLEKFKKVPESLETLGVELVKELVVSGNRESIEEAVKKSSRMGEKMVGSFQAKAINQVDFGQFLSHIKDAPLSAATKKAATETRKLLNDAVVSKTNKEEYANSSGISFNPKLGGMDTMSAEDVKILGKFGKFLGLKEDTGRHNDADLPGSWNVFINLMNDEKMQDQLSAAVVKQGRASA